MILWKPFIQWWTLTFRCEHISYYDNLYSRSNLWASRKLEWENVMGDSRRIISRIPSILWFCNASKLKSTVLFSTVLWFCSAMYRRQRRSSLSSWKMYSQSGCRLDRTWRERGGGAETDRQTESKRETVRGGDYYWNNNVNHREKTNNSHQKCMEEHSSLFLWL